MFTRSASILPLAGFFLLSARHALAQSCLAYNIDFVNGGSYFINTNSNASFTCVTEFSGMIAYELCLPDNTNTMTQAARTTQQTSSSQVLMHPAILQAPKFTARIFRWNLIILLSFQHALF